MLTIKEICAKSGISIHTFQSWRRNDSVLLPSPVAVKKRIIYFDDSILQRIDFIRTKLAEGKTLAEIEKILEPELIREHTRIIRSNIVRAELAEYAEEAEQLLKKWESGDCKDEVCLALNLDPVLSGDPQAVAMPADRKQWGTIHAFIAIISHATVYLTELYANLAGEIEVLQTQTISIADYSMMLFLIIREYAVDGELFKTNMLPYLFFHGMDGTGTSNEYNKNLITAAQLYNKIMDAGSEFMEKLKEYNNQ